MKERSLTFQTTTVIYHSRDMDGWTSAAILQKKYPGCTLIGYDYGDPIPTIPENTEYIIMVDVCVEPEQMRHLAKTGKHGLTYIDHHQSSIEIFLDDIEKNGVYNVGYVFTQPDEKLAACELTWQHCFPTSKIPIYVHLIGCIDSNRSSDRYPAGVIEIWVKGLHAIHHFVSPETCPMWLLDKEEDTISMTYAFQKKQQQDLYEYCLIHSFEDNVGEYKVLCLETTHSHPEAFTGVFDEVKHDIMLRFSQKGAFWMCGIYSLRDDINASKIAKEYDGGGHSYAAGFQIEDISKLLINYKK